MERNVNYAWVWQLDFFVLFVNYFKAWMEYLEHLLNELSIIQVVNFRAKWFNDFKNVKFNV